MGDERKTAERFAADINRHDVSVLVDNGIYRHLRCRRPGTGCMGFDIITWPGYLAYCGDMGEYMFTRIDDMFAFFRNDARRINPGYWAEKCVAADKSDGIEQFSVERFREAVLSDARSKLELDEDAPIPDDAKEELRELLESKDEYECVSAQRDFDSEMFDFADFWEHDCTEYTFRFLWCLHAIVWAIGKYDERNDAK